MAIRVRYAAVILMNLAASAFAENWPAWRGPTANGESRETGLPVTWSPEENVRWKVALPGPGNSTPIIWDDRIYLTQATQRGAQRALQCRDRTDGHLIWEAVVEYSEPEPTHATNPYCSASPVTDGELIVVSHGSAGLFCYNRDGKELWRRDLGPCHHIWGNAF